MNKLILTIGFVVLLSAVGLRGYFAFVPPPEPTLSEKLSDIAPDELLGWTITDLEIAESEEVAERISEFLNFDDSICRVYARGTTTVTLYIAYWTPGKTSYRWAGAHTPDTCWVLAGWEREDRKYAIPFACGGVELKPAEFGVFSNEGNTQNVYFWHLIGGQTFGYSQKGKPNIFGALIDLKHFGLNQRQEQFFVRLSSNRTLEELRVMEGFREIVESLATIGLAIDATGEAQD